MSSEDLSDLQICSRSPELGFLLSCQGMELWLVLAILELDQVSDETGLTFFFPSSAQICMLEGVL